MVYTQSTLDGETSVEDFSYSLPNREQELRVYEERLQKAKCLYNVANELTDSFSYISADSIQSDPRIVKVLRHFIDPPVSQMVLQQALSLPSGYISSIESDSIDNCRNIDRETAVKLSLFFQNEVSERLTKIPNTDSKQLIISDRIAKQETATILRNSEKDTQEAKVSDVLETIGYKKVQVSTLSSTSDLSCGEYCNETKVAANSTTKADVIFKQPDDTITFVEAKRINVKIDTYKRLREIREKKEMLLSEFPNAVVIGVIGGEIDENSLSETEDSVMLFEDSELLESFSNYFDSDDYVFNKSDKTEQSPLQEYTEI